MTETSRVKRIMEGKANILYSIFNNCALMVLWCYVCYGVAVLWCYCVACCSVVVLLGYGVVVLWYCALCADGIVAYFMSFYRLNKQSS